MKINELTWPALDWAVAKCEGRTPHITSKKRIFVNGAFDSSIECNYSTNWAQAGPIIERERICTHPYSGSDWYSQMLNARSEGPTALYAAMRCYVASKLGDEVELPEELL